LPQNTQPHVKKTIYLIRHGETDFNKLGIVQGAGVDTPLNETGKRQAEAFFKHYQHVDFERIYVSSLRRTHETVANFRSLNIPVEIIPELNEINWGIMEGAKPDPVISALFLETLNRWKNGELDFAVEKGESPRALYTRQAAGLKKIMARTEERTILICMHGRAMRSFLCLLTGQELQQMDTFGHSNVCLYILHQTEAGFHIALNNATEHLDAVVQQ